MNRHHGWANQSRRYRGHLDILALETLVDGCMIPLDFDTVGPTVWNELLLADLIGVFPSRKSTIVALLVQPSAEHENSPRIPSKIGITYKTAQKEN